MGTMHPFSARRLAVLSAAGLLVAGGCIPMMVAELILDSDTTASVTVSGNDAELDYLLNQLTGFDVATAVRTVQTGVRVVEIVGTYLEVLDTLNWILAQGVRMVANDSVTEAILVALLK